MTNQEALIEAAYRWMSNNEKIVLEAVSAGVERGIEKAAEAVAVQTAMKIGSFMDRNKDEIVAAIAAASAVEAFGHRRMPGPVIEAETPAEPIARKETP